MASKGSQYDNKPMQYTAITHGCKNGNFQKKKINIFFYFCSKHRLWVHVRAALLSFIEYPQSMFREKKRKIMYIKVHTSNSCEDSILNVHVQHEVK